MRGCPANIYIWSFYLYKYHKNPEELYRDMKKLEDLICKSFNLFEVISFGYENN